ncbi:maternal protein exuperantia-like isoform X2 [Anopheles merus]|uniref:maternal protein exuperantia-like isoform X2 n=1 Tax=Anopheles merus TaxID=30066 RepID=UPI001BE3D787|nr:maternal protein exuperantia-like isoform X2 [Anopheles merus]
MVVDMDESKVGVDEEQHYDDISSDECDTPAGVLSSKFDKTDLSINTNPLPHGKYTLIGLDIDTTGRRLIDEIVQISAFTPEKEYAQYIMPLMNLNPAARQRHQVRVITVGFFRMLKSMQTYRVMKTKMEVAALNEFLDWLEERLREDEGSEGIVLVYHEQRKFVPYMVIEALKKYKLLDRFSHSVKSFVNGFKLAEEKCTKTIKYLTIRQLAKLVLDEKAGSRDGFEGNAAYRARMAFEISRCLATAEPKSNAVNATASSPTESEPNDTATSEEATNSSSTAEDAVKDEGDKPSEENAEQSDDDAQKQDEKKEEAPAASLNSSASRPLTEEDREKMCAVLCEYASPISTEISELDEQEKILVRQNSLRPVFLLYFKTTIYHRVKAVTYRRVLAETGHDYESLRQVWQEKKREGLEAIINEIAELKEDERTELNELLDCHYDPDKQAFKPIVKRMKRRPSRGQPFFSNKNGNVPQNQNGNNQMAKENRKPFNGYQNNQKNHNNHHNGNNNNNNNMVNKHQNQQNQQQQQYYNGPSSPESGMRNGGSPGKRFFQRNSRRRRGGNGQNQNQNGGQNQQPMKNHNGNHHSYSNSNRHNNQFQQPMQGHA